MPRELIYSNETLAGSGSAVVEHVAVGWNKEHGSVQLGVVNGPPVELVINGERSDPGLWMDMDRAQINRLIKVLRIARDGAYGRDE